VSLVIIAYVTLSLHQRLRMFSSIQQSGLVLALLGLNLVLCHWLQIMTTQSANVNLMFLVSALTSAAIWPSLFHLLRQIRRRFAVR
jgi:rod shape-determining protein MreD